MSSTFSTHVLDTAHGCPAAGVAVALADAAGETLFSGATDADGRCPKQSGLQAGRYTVSFAIAAYFRARGVELPDPPFLDVVRIDFGISASGHYHVPLLASPFSCSTYRGS